MEELLRLMVKRKASDLHITVGVPPILRIDGRLLCVDETPLGPEQTRDLVYTILTDEQIAQFEMRKELDTSYSIRGLSRFRVNVFRQRGSVSCAIRCIPFEIPTIDELGLPKVLYDFCSRPQGLFICSGPTGSGKSTTLAAMIEHINSTKNCHIICVEDPIEYLHHHKKSTINQRELGQDTVSFQEALRHLVRQDPDVILVGEMRDLDTMKAVLTLAETGHLVLTTLHTGDAVNAVNRIIDVFPPYQQQQIKVQLSLVLIGIMVQQLIPAASGKGRIAAYEVMNVIPAVASSIREDNLHQIYTILQTGKKSGMNTMNQCLAELCNKEIITYQEAINRSTNPEEFDGLVKQR
jgi:twitching motility protein PilT